MYYVCIVIKNVLNRMTYLQSQAKITTKSISMKTKDSVNYLGKNKDKKQFIRIEKKVPLQV